MTVFATRPAHRLIGERGARRIAFII